MPTYELSDAAVRTIGRALRYYRDYEDALDRADSTGRLDELIAMLDPDPPTADHLANLLRAAAATLEGSSQAASPKATARVIRDALRRWDAAQ